MAFGAKPSLASVASAMGDDEGDVPEAENEDYSTAMDELAEVLGVGDDKMAAFKEAMEAVVRSCM